MPICFPLRVCFKDERKEESETEERIERGRSFQIEGAAKEKERSPKDLFVEGVTSVRGSAVERRDLVGV